MKKAKILIVEDEIIIAMEIAEHLKSMDYDVIKIVSNGKDAIETAINERPSLILMDIMIQGDSDGIETATKIRSLSDIPVIYLTANADEATLQRAKVSDAFGYLIKPFEERELNTTIEMALYKHKMEIKLKESEERFKSLVQNSSIGIFRTDTEGSILLANPSLAKILGFSNSSELIGKKVVSFMPNGLEDWKKLINELQESKTISSKKLTVNKVDGNKITVNVTCNVINRNKNNFYDGTIEDISIREEHERQLIIAKEKAEESDRLKTEFLAGMSHEIRTPINTIMSYVSLLNDDLNDSEDSHYKEIFEAIELGSLRLTRTIDSILNMAQFQSGTFEVYKNKIDIVADLLNNLYQEFKYTAKQRGLELKFSNTAEATSILGDRYSLSQLFVNLIDNGLKYTKSGYVEINVYNDEQGILSVEVSDTGIGISEKFLPTLFEPFTQEEQGYTRKFEGNGLGLALVKRYCDLNDAFIKVSSKKDVGTKFTIKFSQTNTNNQKMNKEIQKNEN